MFREKIPAPQLTAWLFAAMTPVLIQYLGGTAWHWVTLVGVGSILAAWAVRRWGGEPQSHLLSVLQLIFIIILLGELVSDSARSWPVGSNYPAVPLILLALAAWSAQKGVSAAARTGCVLFWFVLIIYLVVFGAGVREMEHRWFEFSKESPDWIGVLIFLTPAASAVLQKGEKGMGRILLPVLFTLCASIITCGVLSVSVAANTDDAFYEMSRSLNLLGVAKRFEALISAAMTTGWFALMSLYLSIAGYLCEQICTGLGRVGTIAAAIIAAGWMLCALHISGAALLVSAAVFWVVLPILAQGIGKIKKS